nr:hypothetical protein [Corallococcus coralloides]
MEWRIDEQPPGCFLGTCGRPHALGECCYGFNEVVIVQLHRRGIAAAWGEDDGVAVARVQAHGLRGAAASGQHHDQ